MRGQEADHRADLFAIGVILYEMLSGRRAFAASSKLEVLNAVLKEEPPELSESTANLPPALAKIVRCCREKTPEKQFQSASDLGFALETLPTPQGEYPNASTYALGSATRTRRSRSRERVAWFGVAVFALIALALAVAYYRRQAAEVKAIHFSIPPPERRNTRR